MNYETAYIEILEYVNSERRETMQIMNDCQNRRTQPPVLVQAERYREAAKRLDWLEIILKKMDIINGGA